MTDDAQARQSEEPKFMPFEQYACLQPQILRMAISGRAGNQYEWQAFIEGVNEALLKARREGFEMAKTAAADWCEQHPNESLLIASLTYPEGE